MPFVKIQDWLNQEKQLGCAFSEHGVLAPSTSTAVPHSRVVAIREISAKGILFFTKRGTRKVVELQANPLASMTIWLALQQRQVTIEGEVVALSEFENESYWNNLPRDRQLRFCAYAPTSAQPISSLALLDENLIQLTELYKNKIIPCSPYYLGFRLLPARICFYTLGNEKFSEVIHYSLSTTGWPIQLVSP
jgi:pyridoxamine 5'-phosphate oxidase